LPFSGDLKREELLKREIARKILETIRGNPNIWPKDLKSKLGYARGTINYYVQGLQLIGLVERIGNRLIPIRPRSRLVTLAARKMRSVYDVVLKAYCYKGAFSYGEGEPMVESKSRRRIEATVSSTAATQVQPESTSFLSQAIEYVWRAVLPLLILSSLPPTKSGATENKVDLTISIDYTIPTCEHLWDLMDGFEKSETMEELTDALELGLILRSRVGRRKKELERYVSEDFAKERLENPFMKYGVLYSRIRERLPPREV
jgi:hypothetical protein